MSAWGWGVPSAVDPLVAEVERLRKTAPEQQAKIDALAAALERMLALADALHRRTGGPCLCGACDEAKAALRLAGRTP